MTLDGLLDRVDSLTQFIAAHHRTADGKTLGNHQLVPLFETIDNGLRRMLLAYSTGAGKTIIPVQAIGHLQRKKHHALRTLIIAPYQTVIENWNQELFDTNGVKAHVTRIDNPHDLATAHDSSVIVVNYDKLPERLAYTDPLCDYASHADVIIVDECHNVKNRRGKMSRGLQTIIEASKSKDRAGNYQTRLFALSASPVPNKIVDLGILLYMIDPDRFAHYTELPFRMDTDAQSYWELYDKGHIRWFDRDATREFFCLPPLIEEEPIKVPMTLDDQDQYFAAFTECFGGEAKTLGRAITAIERASVSSILQSDKMSDDIARRHTAGNAFLLFSGLRNHGQHEEPSRAIFNQARNMLCRAGIPDAAIAEIHGDTQKSRRRDIQTAFHEGAITAIICQWACTDEGFSLVNTKQPVTVVPLRSPFSIGQRMQIQGRAHRPGQAHPVEYVEYHADSPELRCRIDDYVRTYAAEHGRTVNSTWSPTLFHQDCRNICNDKERIVGALLTSRHHTITPDDNHNVDSLLELARLRTRERIIEQKPDDSFGNGIRACVKYIGIPYETGFARGAGPLGRDFDRDDILHHMPGKINLFISLMIDNYKASENATRRGWRIADLGCATSAPFAQARLLHNTLHGTTHDHITSVDGIEGFINSAKRRLISKTWLDAIRQLQLPGYTHEQIAEAADTLAQEDLARRLRFLHANFTQSPFGTGYDVIIASRCLHYNDQTNNRDIERAIFAMNNALKIGGHAIIVLTGNGRSGNFTTQDDIHGIQGILEDYHLHVKEYKIIEGKTNGRTTLRPFPYIHAVKEREAHDLLGRRDEEVPKVYLPLFEVLTGGKKTLDLRQQATKTAGTRERHATPMPDSFYDETGTKVI